MKNWFLINQIDDNTFAICEPLHPEETNSYLLVGSEKALLIDTGLGISDISAEVRGLTDKPVVAVPTHVHWDHIGGLEYFPVFYVHESEKDWIEIKFPLTDEFVRKLIVKGINLTDIHIPDDYAVFHGKASGFLSDGDKIDIGGREICVLHTPGHSPGHMCFYEEKTGCLFTGDLIYKGTLFANYESTDPEKYLESVRKIAGLSVKKVFPAHHTLSLPPEIIKEVLNGLTKIRNEGKLCHGSGLFCYDEWSILL